MSSKEVNLGENINDLINNYIKTQNLNDIESAKYKNHIDLTFQKNFNEATEFYKANNSNGKQYDLFIKSDQEEFTVFKALLEKCGFKIGYGEASRWSCQDEREEKDFLLLFPYNPMHSLRYYGHRLPIVPAHYTQPKLTFSDNANKILNDFLMKHFEKIGPTKLTQYKDEIIKTVMNVIHTAHEIYLKNPYQKDQLHHMTTFKATLAEYEVFEALLKDCGFRTGYGSFGPFGPIDSYRDNDCKLLFPQDLVNIYQNPKNMKYGIYNLGVYPIVYYPSINPNQKNEQLSEEVVTVNQDTQDPKKTSGS